MNILHFFHTFQSDRVLKRTVPSDLLGIEEDRFYTDDSTCKQGKSIYLKSYFHL